jgi:hypothetical protein
MQSKFVGALVVLNLLLLSLGAGWLLTRRPPEEAAQPPALGTPATAPAGADLASRLDEFDRRLGNLERRVSAVESMAAQARDLAEALRDQRSGAAPAATSPAAVRGPGAAGSGGDATSSGTPDSAKTDDQLREERIRKIQAAVHERARTWVPAKLAAIGSTDPKAVEQRRTEARLEAHQMAVALALTPEQADKLQEIWIENADRMTREVSPLLKDGVEKADLEAVETKLSEGWAEMDRRAKEALGEAQFAKLDEATGSSRSLIREVIGDMKSKRK